MNDIEILKKRLDMFNSCIINKELFTKLNKLYKFKPVTIGKIIYFYNKKRNCYALKQQDSLISKDPTIYIDKTWYKNELFATNSETLQEIGKNTPELYLFYKEFKEKQEKERHHFGSLTNFVGSALDELLAMDKT